MLQGESSSRRILIRGATYDAIAEYQPSTNDIKVDLFRANSKKLNPPDRNGNLLMNDWVVLTLILILPLVLYFTHIFDLEAIVTYMQCGPMIFCLFTVLYVAVTFKNIRSWHGAEHKAIEAFMRSHTYDIEIIKNCSRISRYCGSRFMAYMILISIAVFFLGNLSDIFILFSWLIFFEMQRIIFRLDGLLMEAGLNWPAIYISYFLQKYITTSEPGEAELRTAQAAVKAVVEAEKANGTLGELFK